jgi:hypothetical protein
MPDIDAAELAEDLGTALEEGIASFIADLKKNPQLSPSVERVIEEAGSGFGSGHGCRGI